MPRCLNVVLLRDATRQLMLASDHMTPIAHSFDLRDASAWTLIRDAMRRLMTPENETIRVIGQPVNDAGLLIEITMPTEPLRMALIDYGLRILALSAFISVVTAALLFISVRFLLVLPIKRVVGHMMSYAEAPEDASRIIEPQGSVRELRDAETALQSMQTQLTGALKQRERLAQLGEAVAKISHDLRNILSVTTLMADRLEASDDPAVQRATPKILASLTRAVNLTESTLAFGRAEEPSPKLERVRLADIAEDVVENERLTNDKGPRTLVSRIPAMCPRTRVARRSRTAAPRAVEPRAQRAAGHRGHGQGGRDPDRGIASRTAAGGSRSATPVPACRKRRSIIFSSRFTAVRAKGDRSRPRHRGGDRPRPWRDTGACANRPRRHDLRHLPSRGSGGLSASRTPYPLRPLAADAKPRPHAPVAQLDRVLDYESRGRGFESSPVRHFLHLRYRPSGCLSESLLRYRSSGRLSVG
jgi:signal transduction histidine kinase